MTLREAIAAATDSAGRIHSTRALALAIDEADAQLSRVPVLADDLLYGTRVDLCRALALKVSTSGPAIVAAVVTICERAIDWETRCADALRKLAHRPTVIAYTAACRDRDEARDVVDRCANALRRRVPEMSTMGGPCLPGEVDQALLSMAHFRDEAQRERDEARTAYVDDTADRNQIRAERDEARAEVERLRVERDEIDGDKCKLSLVLRDTQRERTALRERVAELEATRPPEPVDWRSLPQLDGVDARECERLVREAEERGARWALEEWVRCGFSGSVLEGRGREEAAARICREARGGEHG